MFLDLGDLGFLAQIFPVFRNIWRGDPIRFSFVLALWTAFALVGGLFKVWILGIILELLPLLLQSLWLLIFGLRLLLTSRA